MNRLKEKRVMDGDVKKGWVVQDTRVIMERNKNRSYRLNQVEVVQYMI